MNRKPADARWRGLAGVCLALALAFQGSRGLWGPDEGRYGECAREMLASGDWLTPRLNGDLHLSKPPFAYWMIAAGLKLLGPNEWGARFFHGLATALTALLVGGLGAALWDEAAGLLAGFMYAAALAPFAAGQLITTDVPLAFWETLAMWCYVRAFRAEAEKARARWTTAMWIAFGAAVFTKGHAGLLPLAVIVAFQFTQRRRGARVVRLFRPLGLALFLALGGWWYVAMCLRHEGVLKYFVERQVLGHIALDVKEAHHTAWYYPFVLYIPTLALGMLPWACGWPALILRWRRRGGTIAGLWAEPIPRLLLLWIALPLAVFCLISSRMPLYVLPLFAPLTLATTQGFRTAWRWGDPGAGSRRRWLAAAAWCALLLTGKAVLARWPTTRDARAAYQALAPILEKGPCRVYFLSRPKCGFAFYARRPIPLVAYDAESLKRLFAAATPLDPAKPTRYVFLSRKRGAPTHLKEMAKVGLKGVPHKLNKKWVAIETFVLDGPRFAPARGGPPGAAPQ